MKRFLHLVALMFWIAPCFAQEEKVTPTPALKATPTPTITHTPTPSIIPTPISLNAEYVGNGEAHFYTGEINFRDDKNRLQKIDNSFFENVISFDGKKEYQFSKSRINSKLIAGTTDNFYQVVPDRIYPDRKMSWTLHSVQWDSVDSKLSLSSDYTKESNEKYAAGDLILQRGGTYERLFVRAKPMSKEYRIEFILTLSDLLCDCKQGEAGKYTIKRPDGSVVVRIYRPKQVDADFSLVKDDNGIIQGEHSLVSIGKGKFLYAKWGTISKSAAWIDVDFYSGAQDGYISSVSTTWSGVIDGSNLTMSVNNAYAYTRTQKGTSNYQVYRAFIPFDTSSIGAKTVVTSASLYLRAKTLASSSPEGTSNLYVGSQGKYLATEDWASFGDYLGTFVNKDTDSYGSMEITPSRIQKTEETYFVLRDYYDHINTPPDTILDHYISYYNSEYSGESSDPKLVVIYASPTPTPNVANPFMGVAF